MKIKIYQINSDRDTLRVKFTGMHKTQKIQQSSGHSSLIDPTLYDEVFSGEVDCKTLEDVYTLFNINHPPFFRGHSLSISDIVQITENKNNYLHGAFFCDSFGFESINFDASETVKPENLLRVVGLEPGKPSYEAEITDDFRAFQQAVRGHFEIAYPFEDDAVLVVNEEGLIHEMEPNCIINGNLYVGPAFIVRNGGDGNFYSLTDSQVQEYIAAFKGSEFIEEFDEDIDSGIQMQ